MTTSALAAIAVLGALISGAPLGAATAVAGTSPSAGTEQRGRIVSRSVEGNTLQLTFRADGLPAGVTLGPDSVQVRVNGATVEAVAEPVRAADTTTRVVVLAIDNSRSMIRDGRLESAKVAAATFLDGLAGGYQVGLVTFADTETLVTPPTSDRDLVRSSIERITVNASIGTALFDGTVLAADSTGSGGERSVLLLTDGDEDGSSTLTPDEAVARVIADGIALDAVYIGPEAGEPPELTDLVSRTRGRIVTSSPDDLARVFGDQAQALSGQLRIVADLPASAGSSGSVSVSATAGAATFEDQVFTAFGVPPPPASPEAGPVPIASAASGLAALVDRRALPVLAAAVFLALSGLAYLALATAARNGKQGRLRRRLTLYTLTGRAPARQEQPTALGRSQVARSAVELAGRVVAKRDFETALAHRLEAGGVPLRAAEWMIIHIGIAISAAFLLALVTAGAVLPTVVGLLAGLVLPWSYLLVKESRRTSEFLAQLPDTLQLVAGSLSAGYSIPQAMDTVVSEGQQPITGEFNRALVEARLGVPIEDAMDGIAARMKSKDFGWVVMAIRVQREVGGNLAELLTTVATTLRERERLRRQVKVLSAEGRLSAWILGLLPLAFALYLVIVRPEYLKPLVTEGLGVLLLVVGVVLLVVGILWMRKAIKVEV